VIEGTNGVLIAEVARLSYLGGPDTTVLDTTYGRGSFWTCYRPPGLVRTVSDFRQLPHPDASVEVVVFDPPYISTGNRATSSIDDFYDRFGLGEFRGWREIRRLIDDGLAECARVLAPRGRVFVKCMDYVESGRKVWNTFHVYDEAEQLGLRLVDRFHHLTGGGPQPKDNLDGTPREQRTAREVTSMLLVFTK
jgi:tRNA G10  N-methylase Trm11